VCRKAAGRAPIPLVLCLLWPGGAVRFRRD